MKHQQIQFCTTSDGVRLALAAFLGDPPLRGALPGTATTMQRLEYGIRKLEENWLIKVIAILAAITGLVIFFVEIWQMWR